MSVRKSFRRRAFQKPTLCLLHINTFVLELCQCYCAGVGGDSGVQFTTMRRASDVFDRDSVVAHEGYLGLELIQAHVQTSFSSPAKKQSLQLHTRRVCGFTDVSTCQLLSLTL